MRLFEADENFLDVLELILRNQIQRADAKNSTQVFSFEALSNMLKNHGFGPITFEEFKQLYDSSPELQSLIDNHDEHTITLKTKDKIEGEPDIGNDLAITAPSVDQLAARGAKSHLNQIS